MDLPLDNIQVPYCGFRKMETVFLPFYFVGVIE